MGKSVAAEEAQRNRVRLMRALALIKKMTPTCRPGPECLVVGKLVAIHDLQYFDGFNQS